jgi:multidrug efflux pump subunit AcrA (membrane-fusion protein)
MAGLCLAGCSSPANSEGGETAREAADAFKTAHAAALGKTVDTLTAGDKAAVDAALSAYAALTAEAKALLGAEKALLDSLKTKLQTLGITAFTILNEDGNLVSDIPENIHISKGARESFSITTTGDLTHIRWSLNWAAIPDPRGSARIISFEAASFSVGSYTVTLYAEKDGIPYLFNAVFIVEN